MGRVRAHQEDRAFQCGPLRLEPVKGGILDDFSVLEVLDHDPLEKLWGNRGIPHAIRIDDHDWAARANAETWRFATLYTLRAE